MMTARRMSKARTHSAGARTLSISGDSFYKIPMNDNRLRRLLVDAAREFNAGRYFEAHEVIEDGLEQVPDDLWELCIGLIQIAVGYHKTTQGLWRGAAKMLS